MKLEEKVLQQLQEDLKKCKTMDGLLGKDGAIKKLINSAVEQMHFPEQLFKAVFVGAKDLLQIYPAVPTLFLGYGISSVSTAFGDSG
jgi:hypothetical protein